MKAAFIKQRIDEYTVRYRLCYPSYLNAMKALSWRVVRYTDWEVR